MYKQWESSKLEELIRIYHDMRPHWFYQENMDSHIISMNQTCTTCPLICGEICGVLQQTLGCFYQMEPNPLNLLGIALICLLIFFPTERGIRDDLIQDMPSPWDVSITSSPWTWWTSCVNPMRPDGTMVSWWRTRDKFCQCRFYENIRIEFLMPYYTYLIYLNGF